MNRLLATSALALVLLGGPALAQQSSTSNAASNAQQAQGQVQTQGSITNGGSSANNGGVNVGAQTSTSDANSHSNSESNSLSVSRGGNATGGNSTSTSAGGQSASTATGGSSSATANPNASNAGNAQNITFNSPEAPTHTTTDVKSAPTVYAPALSTTLTETCMGSSSAAGSGMGWGLSFGSNWRDDECVRRLNAREVASLTGDREAARAILCQDKDVYNAFMAVGRPCPGAPGYAEQGPNSYVPPPPPPPPAQYLYASPPPPPPPPPAPQSEQQSAQPYGTMAPIPNPPPPDGKVPRD